MDFGKYDKNGKGFDFEQFGSKLDSEEVKKNKELQKFFGIFDTENNNGVIDTELEKKSLFTKANQYDENQDGALDDSEIKKILNSEPDMQAIKDDKNVFDAIKSFFANLKSDNANETKTSEQNGKIIKNNDGSTTIFQITPFGVSSTNIKDGMVQSYAYYRGYSIEDVENNKSQKMIEGSIAPNGIKEEVVYDNNGNIEEKYIQIVVNEGDTLSRIANFCNVNTEVIKQENKLDGNSIKMGQVLQIPVDVNYDISKLKSRASVADDYNEKLQQALKNVYSSPIKTKDLADKKFKSLEEAAQYVLNMQGKQKPTLQELLVVTKEIMLLNGEGDDIGSFTKSALKNINSGKLKYLGNKTHDKALLKACGFSETPENSEFYQKYYATLDSILSTAENSTSKKDAQTLYDLAGKIHTTIKKCYESEIKDTEKVKSAILRECGINLYNENEAQIAQDQIYQDFCVNLLVSIQKMRVENKQNISSSLLGTVQGELAQLPKLLGINIATSDDLVDLYEKDLKFFESLSSENLKFEDFQRIFKAIFKQDLNPEKVRELMTLCEKNDVSFKDKEFKATFSEVFNDDLLKETLKENTIDKIFTTSFDITAFLTLMGIVGKSAPMQNLMVKSNYTLSQTLNLSTKATKLGLGVISGAASMGGVTLTEEILVALLKQDPTALENIPKDVLKSAGFGGAAGALNILAIEPLCARKGIEEGIKTVEKAITQKTSLAELPVMLEKATDPVIKSALGRFGYTMGVNTLGFTAYNVASDVIDDTLISKEGKIAEYGVGKYLGESFLANLKGILSFEGVKGLITFIATGKFAASQASNFTRMEDIVDCYKAINECTIEPYENGAEGQAKTYILRSSNGQTMQVTAQQALNISAFLMQAEGCQHLVQDINERISIVEDTKLQQQYKSKLDAILHQELTSDTINVLNELYNSIALTSVKDVFKNDPVFCKEIDRFAGNLDGNAMSDFLYQVECQGNFNPETGEAYTPEALANYTRANINTYVSLNGSRPQFNNIIKSQYNGIDFVKTLTEQERKILAQGLDLDLMQESFVMMMYDAKPAGLYCTEHRSGKLASEVYADILKKLPADKFDIVQRGSNPIFLVTNKEMTKTIINENKELFTNRLGLNKDATIDEIYSAIIDPAGDFAKSVGIFNSKCNDLAGLVLGYPKYNTLIFELENVAKINFTARESEDLTSYKQQLINTLYGENSPYKGMSDEFKQDLEQKINGIKKVLHSKDVVGFNGYTFIYFTEEPTEIARIQSQVKRVAEELDKISQISQQTDFVQNKAQKTEAEVKINIPRGRFEAPNTKFAETDEAFRSIVTKRSADIKELDKITDIDEFCRKSFELMKEEMGLEDSDIRFEITDEENLYDHETNTVCVSRNWAGREKGHVKGQGDKAEIFGDIAHELNHFLQWKEVVLNLDSENPDWNNIIDYLQSFEGAQKNIEYLIEKYPDNLGLKDAFEKAKTYQENWLNYVDAFDENGKLKTGEEYKKYENQIVEVESRRRGDIVVEEYKKVTVAKEAKSVDIKILSDEEFDNLKQQVEKKLNKASENDKNYLLGLIKTLTKENIQIVDRILSDKKPNELISQFSNELLMLENIYQAKMINFIMDNLNEIRSTEIIRGLYDIVAVTKKAEDYDLKTEIINYALENQGFGNSSHLSKIAACSSSLEEAVKTYEFTEKYCVTPEKYKEFAQEYGTQIFENIAKAKENFGFNIDNIEGFRSDDKYIYANTGGSFYKDHLHFCFDKATGELLSVKQNNRVFNIKENKITQTTPIEINMQKDAVLSQEQLLAAITETTDLAGNWLGSVEFRKSKIDGEFKIIEYDRNGEQYQSGIAEFDKNGGKHIERHVTSLDGTVTDYVYADDKAGNRFLYYKVTDSKGSVLYESTKKFRVIDDDHYVTTDNGQSFDILYTKDNVTITKLDDNGNKTDEKVVYQIKNYTKSDYKRFEDIVDNSLRDPKIGEAIKKGELSSVDVLLQKNGIDLHTIDRKMLPALKQLSGAEWFDLDRIGTETIRLCNTKNNGHSIGGGIEISSNLSNILSILEHEIGHEKYNFNDFEHDEEFLRIYNEEKRLCKNLLSDIELQQMNYFLAQCMNNPTSETAAESNQNTNIPNGWKSIGSRSFYLMKFLPRTIAYVANKNESISQKSRVESKPEVKPELPEITIENVEDILLNKNLINKAFSPVQIEHIRYGLEKCPDKLPLIETILSAKGLNEEQIVKLLTSEKISSEDLANINEYIKVANEQGFDLITLLESSEEGFNKFIEEESARVQNPNQKAPERTGVTVTKDKNELISQLKQLKVQKYYLENIKDLNPEEIENLSELLSVVDIKINQYYIDTYIETLKYITPENKNVIKLYVESYDINRKDELLKSVLDELAKKPELIEFTEKFLMYKKELNEYKKQNPNFNNYGNNYIGSGYILQGILERLENKQQGECLLALLNSNSYYYIESNFRAMFQLAQIMKNPSDAEDLPKITQIERHIDSQIVKDYMSLPKEDRALLDIFLNGDKETLKMFDRINLGSFIIKGLKEPETQPYMKSIMQKVKTIDDMKQLYIIDYCNKDNIPLADKLYADKDFPNNVIVNILRATHEHNIRLAEKLCADKDFPNDEIPVVLKFTTEQNQDAKIAIYEKLKANLEFPKEEIANILCNVTKHNIQLAEKLCADKDFPKDMIANILGHTKGYNIQLAEKLCSNKDFPQYFICGTLRYTDEKNIALVEKLCSDKDFPKDMIVGILRYTNEKNITLAEKLCADKDFPKDMIANILGHTKEYNIQLAETLCADKDFPKEKIANILDSIKECNIQLAEKLCADKDFHKNMIAAILNNTEEYNIQFAEKLYEDKDYPNDMIPGILRYTNEKNITLAEKLCADKEFPKGNIPGILQFTNEKNITLAEKLCADKDFVKGYISDILQNVNEKNITLAEKLCSNKDFPQYFISGILRYTDEKNIALAEKLCSDKDFYEGYICDILRYTNEKNITFAEKLCYDKDFREDKIPYILSSTNEKNITFAEKLCFDKSIDCPKEFIADIIHRYVEGTEDSVIRIIKEGQLKQYPKLTEYHTDCWDNIIKRDLLNIQKESSSSKGLIEAYARSREENIAQLHKQLYQDALENKDLLKSGTEDITDQEIFLNMHNEYTVKAIDLIGLTGVEAAFPLMLEEFGEFIYVLNNTKYSDSNRELLLERVNPQNSLKCKKLNEEIAQLKKSLNEVVGKDNLAKIRNLQEQKSKVDEQLKQLKQNENADNPEIKSQMKELQKQSKLLGSQAQSIYYQGENAPKIKEIMAQISAKTKELKTLLSANSGLAPQEVVTKMRVLSALTEISTEEEVTEFIEMIKTPTPENEAKWNDAVNKKIFQKLNIEYDENLSQKLDLVHCKYISKLFVSSPEFFQNLQRLVTVIKNNPNLTVEQAIDNMPQNIETKRIFEELGFDYEKFTKVDKESYTSVNIELNAEEAKQMSIHNLEEDLNDALFQSLPKEVTEPIFAALKEQLGVTFVKSQKDNWDSYGFDAGASEYYRLYKDGKPIEFDEMDKIVSVIKKEINGNDFWTQTNDDTQIENARGTMYTHLIKMRTQEVDNAASIKDGETAEIEVRKTDMYDVKKALGLGNDAQCCTALGRNFNEWSAPTYIANKCIGAIELTDKGSFVGNTMIYLAYVDGKPALVLDNIELKTKYQNNDKIRDTFVEYAKKLCAEIGQPDLPIFAGPNRHKLDMGIYEKATHSMEIIGSSGSDYVYVDYDAFRHVVGNGEVVNIDMYRLR